MKSVFHVALIASPHHTNKGLMDGFLSNDYGSYYFFDYQVERFEFGIEKMRERMIQRAEMHKADLIFLHVQNSEIIDISTVQKLSKISKTVLYTFDCRSREKTEWMYALAPFLNFVCFSNQEDCDEAQRRGLINTMVLQSSCDMDLYVPSRHKDAVDLRMMSFIGNNYASSSLEFPLAQERLSMVAHLENTFPTHFKAYGMGWGRGVNKLVVPWEEVDIYYRSQIALSHNNFNCTLYTSDRLWKIMATGTFCLTKYFPGIETMFQRGVHLDWWRDVYELDTKIMHYMSDFAETYAIAKVGCAYVRENHTWAARIKEMDAVLWKRSVSEIKKDNIPCRDAHRIQGEIPNASDQKFDGMPCDCGKLIWIWEECGCTEKYFQLRAKQNPAV